MLGHCFCAFLILSVGTAPSHSAVNFDPQLKDMDSTTFSWVRHFLTERTFQVRVNGTVSDYIARPSHGLPQGSPLSVVLWKVFVIDIPMWNNDNLYMDDLNYNVDEETFDEAEEEANRRLSILNDWAKENGVLFDKKKTKVLVHEQHVDIEDYRVVFQQFSNRRSKAISPLQKQKGLRLH